jgi:hypothetical protein
MLLVQGLLYIDFAHDLHDLLMKESDNPENYIPQACYLTFSAAAVVSAAVGFAFLFENYTDCGIGMFFVVTTLVVGAITTFLSLLSTFNKGLLTPCLMLGYSVFMCWYALLSNPSTTCNPSADELSASDDVAIAIIASITFLVVMYCVVNGTRIFDAFDIGGQGVMMTYQPEQKRALDAVLTGQCLVPHSLDYSFTLLSSRISRRCPIYDRLAIALVSPAYLAVPGSSFT